MPRPRFHKLPIEKQENILASAAREFAANGYHNASLNQILVNAGLSKGAAYYYFDDKADLFITAVTHYSQMIMADITFDLEMLTAENFWSVLGEVYRHQFHQAQDRPWIFGAIKAAGSLSPELLAQEPLASFAEEMQATLRQLLIRGQAVGVIRTDLSDDLLYALVMAIDEAHDQWLLPQWSTMDADDIATAVARIINLLQRLLSPSL